MKDKSSTFTIGIDLGDRKHAVCVLDARGEVVKQETIGDRTRFARNRDVAAFLGLVPKTLHPTAVNVLL